MQREKFSRVCESCKNDCKEIVMGSPQNCPHFKLGLTIKEYKQMIREENLNIKKFCNKNGLSNNCLLNMLNDKQVMKYKYRVLLEDRLTEKEEYLKWSEDKNVEE